MAERVKKVTAGMTVPVAARDGLMSTVTIKEPCAAKDNGNWYCVTHEQLLLNPSDVEHHTQRRSKHLLAWHCKEHGLEQP